MLAFRLALASVKPTQHRRRRCTTWAILLCSSYQSFNGTVADSAIVPLRQHDTVAVLCKADRHRSVTE